jgi:molybdate/tungstate transport system substrate-binding protein
MESAAGHGERRLRRRTLMAIGGGVVGTSLAGCLLQTDSVSVLAAGSLARTFESHVGPAFRDETDTRVDGEYFGTNAVMRMVEDRTKRPDVVVSADATLLRDRLYGDCTEWDVEFATNCLGIGYNDETTFGQRLEAGTPWYELARRTDEGDLSIGDPDLDPLGYRAVMAFELAEREHALDGFRDRMLEIVHEEPDEPAMMAAVETGARAGAVVYRNMAVDRGLPFVEFPDSYNFANPALAEQYATVAFTTDEEGYTARGRPIVYNATVPDFATNPEAGRRLVQFLVDNPGLLVDAGLTVPGVLPQRAGRLPEAVSL